MSADGSPKLRYDGKVTIVTGGSKGIGEGIVREFGENLFIVKLRTLRRPFCGRMYEAKKVFVQKRTRLTVPCNKSYDVLF